MEGSKEIRDYLESQGFEKVWGPGEKSGFAYEKTINHHKLGDIVIVSNLDATTWSKDEDTYGVLCYHIDYEPTLKEIKECLEEIKKDEPDTIKD